MGFWSKKKKNSASNANISQTLKKDKKPKETLKNKKSVKDSNRSKSRSSQNINKTLKKLKKSLKIKDLELFVCRWPYSGLTNGDLLIPEAYTKVWASTSAFENLNEHVECRLESNLKMTGFVQKDYLVRISDPRAYVGYTTKSRNELGDFPDYMFALRPCSDKSDKLICALTYCKDRIMSHFKIERRQDGTVGILGQQTGYSDLNELIDCIISFHYTPYIEPEPPLIPRMPIKNIEACDLRIIKILGSGNFGTVELADLHMQNGGKKQVAVKKLKNVKEKEEFCSETYIMLWLKDGLGQEQGTDSKQEKIYKTHLVNILAAQMDREMAMIIEYCNGDSVENLMKTFKESEIIIFTIHLFRACCYLAKKNIIHRDIAARNVLCNIEGKSKIFKLSDFGLAVYFDNKEILQSDSTMNSNQPNSKSELPRLTYENTRKSKSPIRWTSPEMLLVLKSHDELEFKKNLRMLSTKDNVWMAGITVMEVCDRKSPWNKMNDLRVVRNHIMTFNDIDGPSPKYPKPQFVHQQFYDAIAQSCIVPIYMRVDAAIIEEKLSCIKVEKNKVEYGAIADFTK